MISLSTACDAMKVAGKKRTTFWPILSGLGLCRKLRNGRTSISAMVKHRDLRIDGRGMSCEVAVVALRQLRPRPAGGPREREYEGKRLQVRCAAARGANPRGARVSASQVARLAVHFAADGAASERGSQMRAAPSRDAVASRVPPGLKERLLGGASGPLSSSRRAPSSRFQRRMTKSAAAVARMGRVGCQASAVIGAL